MGKLEISAFTSNALYYAYEPVPHTWLYVGNSKINLIAPKHMLSSNK